MGENLWMRVFPYPSVTYSDPSDATATSVGRLNGRPLCFGEGWFGTPRVSRTVPSNVHLRIVWSPSSVR